MVEREMRRFAGRVVIVTGAASGIGRAAAARFLDEGAMVVLVDREEGALKQAVAALDPARAVSFTADIADPAQVSRLHDFVRERCGRVDVLVNNAGVTAMGTVLEAGLEAWDEVAATNLRGTIDMSRTFLPMLRDVRGNIVNVVSVSGMRGDWNTPYYNVAKGGLENLTRSMAMDHGGEGVRVNGVCPSVTRTAMTAAALEDAAFVERLEARIPLGRLGEPEDQAAAIAFLASDDARFITGALLPVDGGVTASSGQPPFPK